MAPTGITKWKGKEFKDADHVKVLNMVIGGTAAVDIAKHETKDDMKAVAEYIEDRRDGKKKKPRTVGASKFLWRAYASHPEMDPPGTVVKGLQQNGPKRQTEKKRSVFPIGSPKLVEKSLETWKVMVPEVDLPTLQLIMDHVYWYGVYVEQKEMWKAETIERSLKHWMLLIEGTWREKHQSLNADALFPLSRESPKLVGIPRPEGMRVDQLQILTDLTAYPTDDARQAARPDLPAGDEARKSGSGGAAYRERGFQNTFLGSGSPAPAPAPAAATMPLTQPAPPDRAVATPDAATTPADASGTPPPPKRARVDFTEDLGDDEFADAVQTLFADGGDQPTDPALQQPAPHAAAGDGAPADPAQQQPAPPAPAQRNFLVRVVKGTVGAVGQALVNASR